MQNSIRNKPSISKRRYRKVNTDLDDVWFIYERQYLQCVLYCDKQKQAGQSWNPVYGGMKQLVDISRDVILCDWLRSKYQLAY